MWHMTTYFQNNGVFCTRNFIPTIRGQFYVYLRIITAEMIYNLPIKAGGCCMSINCDTFANNTEAPQT